MSSPISPSWISLAQAMQCLLTGAEPKSDAAQPHQEFTFPDKDPRFGKLLEGLLSGVVQSRGNFSRVEINWRAIEDEDTNGSIAAIWMKLRRDSSFETGRGSEYSHSDIPREAWWYEGAIWERSILWAVEPETYPNDRISGLRIIPYQPFSNERPFELEQRLCFTDVQINVPDFRSWRGPALSDEDDGTKPLNERNAGRKPTENWRSIEEWIEGELKIGTTWKSWIDLWDDISRPQEATDRDAVVKDRSSKLRKHLYKHRRDLFERLREHIERRRPKNTRDS